MFFVEVTFETNVNNLTLHVFVKSIGYTDLLRGIENDKIKLFIENGQDHHFSKREEEFQKIPDKYLFYDESE